MTGLSPIQFTYGYRIAAQLAAGTGRNTSESRSRAAAANNAAEDHDASAQGRTADDTAARHPGAAANAGRAPAGGERRRWYGDHRH